MLAAAFLLAQSVSNEMAPHSGKLALSVLLVAVGVFTLAGLTYLAMREMARGREGTIDPPNMRTVAVFEVAGSTDDASRLQTLAAETREKLGDLRLNADAPVLHAEALFVAVEVKGRAFVLRLARLPGVFTATVLERGAATNALGEESRTPLGSAELPVLLDHLNRALRKLTGVGDVRWHRRESWEAGTRDQGVHAPVG